MSTTSDATRVLEPHKALIAKAIEFRGGCGNTQAVKAVRRFAKHNLNLNLRGVDWVKVVDTMEITDAEEDLRAVTK